MQKFVLNALFLFFCLITQSAFTWSINPSVDTDDTDEYVLSNDYRLNPHNDCRYCAFLGSPFQSPEESNPKPSEPNEKEDINENQNDVEWDGFSFNIDGNFDFVFKCSRDSLVQFEQKVLKRTKISLVVLYHSWKSFLS